MFLILTGCGLPLPEEVAIITAGVAAASPNGLNPGWRWRPAWSARSSATARCISSAGDLEKGFSNGILSGPRSFNPKREKQIEGHLEKHGAKMLLLARFLVGPTFAVLFRRRRAQGELRAVCHHRHDLCADGGQLVLWPDVFLRQADLGGDSRCGSLDYDRRRVGGCDWRHFFLHPSPRQAR